jgi:signal transduction histidine kinase
MIPHTLDGLAAGATRFLLAPQVGAASGSATELAAAWLQGGITLGLALIHLYVYRRYRKAYFGYWALAWAFYSLRLGAIIRFMQTDGPIWLYWHQVATGLTALALLWATLVFAQQTQWRWRYLALAAFPVGWSYFAIYELDNFLLAAGPAVLFLSAATLWTGVSLLRHQKRVASGPARLLGWAFVLWSLHHLDYPFLRAQGAWNPWGYYLDIGFELVIAAGILLLVIEEQDRGLSVLSNLAGDLQADGSEGEALSGLLRRPLTLSGVRGSALYLRNEDNGGSFVAGEGSCESWPAGPPNGTAIELIDEVLATGRPATSASRPRRSGTPGTARADLPFSAALPVFQGNTVTGAIVVRGEARDPFTALDEGFLVALGHQVGAALARRELVERLKKRTRDLQDLTARMLEQHEAERRRLSRELHDETAQVLAAVKLQIGRALESASGSEADVMRRASEMVGSGISGVRRVIDDLRPELLNDLGFRAALAALAFKFERDSTIDMSFVAPDDVPEIEAEAELALFRALQEGLANVARHADASRVDVELSSSGDRLYLTVADDGRGLDDDRDAQNGGGIAGMRERVETLGGRVELSSAQRGTRLTITLPFDSSATT